MTDVWHKQRAHDKIVLHTDKECYQLQKAETVVGPKDLEQFPDYPVCKFCNGQYQNKGGRKKGGGLSSALARADPDSVGVDS